jgi:uncharacterized protein (DUF2141 family)
MEERRRMQAKLTLALLLLAAARNGQPAATVTLTVNVTRLRSASGDVRIAVFRSAEGFPSDTRAAVIYKAAIDPDTRASRLVIEGLPPGDCAVMAFHDENGNGKLDKNLVGIPKEDYGASNNRPKKMRAPTFDEAKFLLEGDRTIEIRLNP